MAGHLSEAGTRRDRRGAWVVGSMAVCAVGTLLVSGLVMATSGASPGASSSTSTTEMAKVAPPTTEPGSAQLLSTNDEAHALAAVRPSLVALTVDRPGGTTTATGIIAESGGVIVTTMAAVAGATSIHTEESDGTREPVAMVGTDPTSGIAVMRVTTDLPVADFDLADPVPGTTAMAVAVTDGARAPTPPASVYAGTVQSSGTAVGADAPTSVFASTVVDTPLDSRDDGCALVDDQGQVTGILDTTETLGGGTVAVFLPASLVLGVARQLVAGGSVERGWLGVEASDVAGAAAGGGAVVDVVDQDGPAAQAGLEVGDTIVAVEGEAVHSMAELSTRLYADLPGTWLQVTFDRAGTERTAGVVLAAEGTDASDVGGSP